MDASLLGETAAVVTAILWTTCSILFASAGKRIGALSVNSIRLFMAVCFLATTHLIWFGTIVPEANGSQWFYLGLSGVIGLALGDSGYFGTLVILGPRKGVLLMSMAPVFSVISAVFILDEVLGLWAIIGITVTIAGVMLVIIETEHDREGGSLPLKKKILGVLFGVIGAVGQGVGLSISKYGMLAGTDGETPLHSLSVTLIRMLAAVVVIWIIVILWGRFGKVLKDMQNKEAMKRTLGGAFTGPFLGVWLSMVAVSLAAVGVAATLMSLMPLFIIPFIWVVYKEKTNWRGIFGAIIAVVGVAILFMV